MKMTNEERINALITLGYEEILQSVVSGFRYLTHDLDLYELNNKEDLILLIWFDKKYYFGYSIYRVGKLSFEEYYDLIPDDFKQKIIWNLDLFQP